MQYGRLLRSQQHLTSTAVNLNALYTIPYLVVTFFIDLRGGWMRRRCRVSRVIGASNWDLLTVGQGLLSLQQVRGDVFIYSVPSLYFIFLFLLCPFLSFPLPSRLSLFSLSLGDDTKWPSRADVSLNPNTTNQMCRPVETKILFKGNSYTFKGDNAVKTVFSLLLFICRPSSDGAWCTWTLTGSYILQLSSLSKIAENYESLSSPLKKMLSCPLALCIGVIISSVFAWKDWIMYFWFITAYLLFVWVL